MEVLQVLFGNLRTSLPPPFLQAVLVLVSLVCGAAVGAERERQDKPAGLRTVTLICLGSTIFTLLSFDGAFGGADPSRIAAQVVTGVGFLGAGAIIRERGSIVGLTTAATIWVVAAIGMVVGAGYALSGLALAVLVPLSLVVLTRLERWIRPEEGQTP